MTPIANPGVQAGLESYQYDPLYRLQQVSNASGTPWQSYTYDKTGDRLSKTTALQTPSDTYSYTPNTHHLIGISGYDPSSRSMDANGNTSAFQANGWMYGLGYNDTNRLSLVQQNGTTIAAYKLDGKGERVRKLLSGATPTEYVYDEAGRLLHEYSGPSQNRSYIWADGTLVATVEDNSTVHYVYTDQLGTPRAVTTTTGTPIWAWSWLQNPFGERAASGAGGYTFNLRYPGQYYDAETGLSYNYFRDYEAGTGRFPESDPIGLMGGISSYAYVGGSPLNYIDQLGLACPVGAGQCIASSNYLFGFGEPTAAGDSATDTIARNNMAALDTSDTDENYGGIDSGYNFIVFHGNGRNTNKGYVGTFNVGGRAMRAICHSHPREYGQWPIPGFGDDGVVRMGVPNYIIRNDTIGVLELRDGQWDYRMIRGRLTSNQINFTQQQLNSYQSQ